MDGRQHVDFIILATRRRAAGHRQQLRLSASTHPQCQRTERHRGCVLARWSAPPDLCRLGDIFPGAYYRRHWDRDARSGHDRYAERNAYQRLRKWCRQSPLRKTADRRHRSQWKSDHGVVHRLDGHPWTVHTRLSRELWILRDWRAHNGFDELSNRHGVGARFRSSWLCGDEPGIQTLLCEYHSQYGLRSRLDEGIRARGHAPPQRNRAAGSHVMDVFL